MKKVNPNKMKLFMMVKSTLKHFGFFKRLSGLCSGEKNVA